MAESSAGKLVLGIDLGTSAVKVVALDLEGVTVGCGSAGFATCSDLPGQAEQDPAAWLAAASSAVEELRRELAPRRPSWHQDIAAIGLTGQLPTLVCSGRDGPLGPAITWKDSRADPTAAASIDSSRRRTLYQRTGMPIDGRYLGPMFLHHWQQRRDEVESILSAKDYLVFVLTGQRVTDPSTAAGYGVYDLTERSFSKELCNQWQLPLAALPNVRPAHSQAGVLTPAAAQMLGLAPDIPVTVGAADSVSSAFAMTGLTAGLACVTMGSSTIILDAIPERRLDPATRYLLTPHVEPGWYGREMDLLATGTGYRWFSELLGWPDGRLDQLAATSIPGGRGLTFTPYLAGGEQGALWDPTRRGSILGLTLQHTAGDLARAFLEGVGFEIRRCLEVLAQTSSIQGVVLAGHLTEHASSLALLADILNKPIHAYTAVSPAAVGAAMGALQLCLSAQPCPPQTTTHRPVTVPGPVADTYQQLYADYLFKTR